MGRRAHLRLALGPFVAGRGRGRRRWRRGRGRRRAAALAPRLDGAPRAARRSDPHRGARRRPPHGTRGLLAQRAPLARAGVEREARRRLRGAGGSRPGLSLPAPRSRASARGRPVWRGDLVLQGYGDPTLDAGRPGRARRRDRRARASAASRAPSSATRRGSTPSAPAPAGSRGFYINESPPLSALIVGAGVYRGRTSHESGARRRRAASEPRSRRAASTSRSRPGSAAHDRRAPARADVSAPLAQIVRYMGRESDNFTGRDAPQAARRGARARLRARPRRGARVVRATLAEPACRSPASASPTARASRGSTGSPRPRSSRCSKPGLARPGHPRRLPRLAGGRRRRRHARAPPRTRPARGRVIAKTGTTQPRLRALRLRPRPLRLRGHPERLAGLDVLVARAQDRFATVLAGAG